MKIKQPALLILFALFCSIEAQCDLLETLSLDNDTTKHETEYTCVPLPPATPPAQHSSAEGLPPLPLPVVPQRRTEKKNPPRPPVLIAKISTQNLADWATNPGDADNLLKWIAKNLNYNYSTINLPQAHIPSDPKDVPLLYRTGHDAFTFTPEAREKMRNYLLKGGTLVMEACCGRSAFAKSALAEMQQLVPGRIPYILPKDHPLFRSYFDIKHIKFRKYARQAGANNDAADIIGLDIGCRTAVFLFRWDVSCGWDDQPDSERHHCLGYDLDSSKQIGSNLMAYITSERSAALPLSQALDFVDANAAKSGKFTIAVAKYTGIWKCREAGLSMLLNAFHDQTQTPVRFQREEVALDSSRIFDMPFMYMTGHDEFTLTESERNNLKSYLLRGGVLFAESCCGREGFSKSFQREMTKMFGDNCLKPLGSAHPLYAYPNVITKVQPRQALARHLGITGTMSPKLLTMQQHSQLSVIFSPYGLACGWELAECPYCRGLASSDALALGVNILSYSLMQ